jgi:REP element-mobilizing transposase RayT
MKSARHNRHNMRLLYFDYAQPGAYFVTICVQDRRSVLGRVVGEDIELRQEGKIVERVWRELPQHYGHVELDQFVVMPNHVHGIVWITDDEPTHVGAGLKPAPTKNAKRHGLPEIIRGFKTFSARRINQLRETTGKAFWQRGYYEHVIRDEDDLYRHRKYIQDNPLKWAADEYYRETIRA